MQAHCQQFIGKTKSEIIAYNTKKDNIEVIQNDTLLVYVDKGESNVVTEYSFKYSICYLQKYIMPMKDLNDLIEVMNKGYINVGYRKWTSIDYSVVYRIFVKNTIPDTFLVTIAAE
jgi:hypothetical protein